ARGLARDEVRMLVARRGDGSTAHARFHDLPRLLDPGDVLVINTSATLPAALPAGDLRLHLSTPAPDDSAHWVVALRDGANPYLRARSGDVVPLPAGGRAVLLARYAAGRRLWVAELDLGGRDVVAYLHEHGHPIRYGYVPRAWPLRDYQTVYALQDGSA